MIAGGLRCLLATMCVRYQSLIYDKHMLIIVMTSFAQGFGNLFQIRSHVAIYFERNLSLRGLAKDSDPSVLAE